MVVAVVRDVHRHPWMAGGGRRAGGRTADTVVVEMGVPQAPPRGALHIATHGAARVCGRAAAEVIARGGPCTRPGRGAPYLLPRPEAGGSRGKQGEGPGQIGLFVSP